MNEVSVMIVDDSKLMRSMLKSILANTDYKVVAEAENGIEMLEQYPQYLPDLVLLDVIMPRMNGLEALEHLLNSHPDANVIIVSSAGKEANVVKAQELGAKNFIIKPFDKDKVMEIINYVID